MFSSVPTERIEQLSDSMLRAVAFAGGGSGGHLFPAVAIAERILCDEPDCRLLFLTSQRPLDQSILESLTLPEGARTTANESESGSHTQSVLPIRIRPLPAVTGRDLIARSWYSIPCLVLAIRQAMRELREQKIRVVVGTGGFASVAPVLAARWLRIPVVLLELNTIPGRANRLLSRFAQITCCGFSLNADWTHRWPGPLIPTGVPLRRNFSQLQPQDQSAASANPTGTLLILGGSQGSVRMNQLVMEVLSNQEVVPLSWNIVHQTGSAQLKEVQAFYTRIGRTATVAAFFADLPEQLRRATLVLSRAGALTLAEIAHSQKSAILIPLSTSSDGHQACNARLLRDQGAALVVDEAVVTAADDLAAALQQCVSQSEFCCTMAERMRSIVGMDGSAAVAAVLRRHAGSAESAIPS